MLALAVTPLKSCLSGDATQCNALESVSFMHALYSRKFKNRTQCVRVISEESGALSLTHLLISDSTRAPCSKALESDIEP